MSQTYNWPEDLAPSKFDIKMKTSRKSFTSPFNGSTQEAYFPGAQWKITMSFDERDDYESRLLESCIYQLESGGRIRIPDFGRKGLDRSGISVFGPGQTGGILITQGWPPNTSSLLSRGDYLEVGDELKFVLEDASSDSAGRVAVKIAPWLRRSHPSGTTVNVRTPCGYFKLPDSDNGVQRSPGMSNAVSLNLIESFY